MLLIISCAIASLLVLGCYYDIKTRHVSNLITGAVIVLSLPLIYHNISNLITTPIPYVIYGIATIAGLLGSMADIKVMIPIGASLSSTSLVSFLLIFCIVGFLYILITKKKNDVPAFVPITAGYVVVMLFA